MCCEEACCASHCHSCRAIWANKCQLFPPSCVLVFLIVNPVAKSRSVTGVNKLKRLEVLVLCRNGSVWGGEIPTAVKPNRVTRVPPATSVYTPCKIIRLLSPPRLILETFLWVVFEGSWHILGSWRKAR